MRSAAPPQAAGAPGHTPSERLDEAVDRFARISPLIAAAIGAIALLGWILDEDLLKSLLPGHITMKPNTALCFLLAGLAASILAGTAPPAGAWIARVIAVSVGLLSMLVLSQDVVGWNLGLDELLFEDRPGAVATVTPGRMAPNTAVCFMLVSVGLLLLDRRIAGKVCLAPVFGALTALIAALALLAYASGISSFYGIAGVTQMAVPTAIAFVMLGTGVALARLEHGALSLFTRDSAGGALVRRLVPAAIAIPLVLGGLRLAGENLGLYSTAFGVWLMAIITVLLLLPLVWRLGLSFDRADAAQRRVVTAAEEREQLLSAARDELEARVAERTVSLERANEDLSGRVEERRKAAAALAAEREQLSAVLHSMTDAVIAANSDGSLRFVNRAGRELFAPNEPPADIKELANRYELRELETNALIPPTQRPLSRSLAGEQIRDFEVVLIRTGEDWRRTMLISAEPVLNADGEATGAVMALHDITERRTAQEARGELQRRLNQSQRLESVGQLAGGIAHDFNNLLAVILNYAQFVAEEVETEALRSDVEEIRRAAERAAGLTRQLLIFSRREVVKPEVLDLNEVVEAAEKLLARTLGEHVYLVTQLDPETHPVLADAGQMEQILVNLAVNARDAMPGGGTLVIETANVELDDAYSGTRADIQPGHYVRLSVSDTGTGMTKDVSDRVFEPFYSTKPKGEGTGLGLATVYGIVREAGGDVALYSESGIGTVFHVYLPAMADRTGAVVKEPEPLGVGGSGETVLVIEDEPAVRAIATRILSTNGYRVIEAGGASEAVAVAAAHDAPIDMILSDVVMPELSGPETVERLHAVHGRVPVLFISGYTHDFVARKQVLEDGVSLLEKPFTTAALLRQVCEVLGSAQRSGAAGRRR